FSQTLFFSVGVFTLLVALSWLTLDSVLHAFGAEGAIFTLSREYLIYLLPFLLNYSINWVVSSFIRNDGNPKLAMVAMVAGALVNIVLDVVFIWWMDMGMGGAALATGLAQWVMTAILLTHFKSKTAQLSLRFSRCRRDVIQRVSSIGAPNFFIELALTITIVVFNFVLLNQYSEAHLIAYSLTINLGVFVLFILLGISQACQPIISYNFGAGNYLWVKQSFSLGLKYGVCIGLSVGVLVSIFASEIVQWFITDDPAQIAMSVEAVRWYFLSAPFMAANIIISTYFQALAQPSKSSVLSLLRGLIFVLVGLFMLPPLLGDKFVWSAFVFAEVMTIGFSLYFVTRNPLPEKSPTNDLHEVAEIKG
ncbi:MATE family efflux transporter, partial [Photobacterium sanctipauli]